MKTELIPELAQRLWQAGNGAPPAHPGTADWLDELELAYAVQHATRDLAIEAGDRVIGYKVGLTSQPARNAFGAGESAAGYLLADRLLEEGQPLSTAGLFEPKVEIEIGFLLGEALPGPNVTTRDVHDATAAVAPAFEIVDSRWRGGARTLPMLVADNTNAAHAVLGSHVAPPWDQPEIPTTLSINNRTVPGNATAVMGDPAEAVAWLAGHLLRNGARLEAGDIVLSGTLCTPTAISAGDRLVADLGELGRIAVDVN
ncbi:fumarylacetoacetate hydrolase family protein [Saccharopolyspora erythraea]|uniref:2-keto-4-pentenoate hydratase n=1 Tax=Saccharopolyspora erythraea TaxID=1836 RepID=UPI001BA82251|nr:fumarylacetoacetate hydrolase family protein [Saccharopolyspora erythraea]QUH01911.1 fumarylacetoacetate hydrolase family protein [Saccharopolyspora erythraea]